MVSGGLLLLVNLPMPAATVLGLAPVSEVPPLAGPQNKESKRAVPVAPSPAAPLGAVVLLAVPLAAAVASPALPLAAVEVPVPVPVLLALLLTTAARGLELELPEAGPYFCRNLSMIVWPLSLCEVTGVALEALVPLLLLVLLLGVVVLVGVIALVG